jgi:hypothetical protein
MVLMASAFGRLQPLGESAELAFAMTFMTIGIMFAERLEEAEPLFRQALAMAEAAARDPEAGYIAIYALSLVQLFLVMCLSYLGRWREAEPMVGKLESLARSSGDVGVYFRAMGMQVLYLHDAEPELDLARIDRLLDEQLDLARKSGRFGDAIYTIDSASWINLIHGRLDAAEALGREALDWSSHGADAFRSEALRASAGSHSCGARSTRPNGSSPRRATSTPATSAAWWTPSSWPGWPGPGVTSRRRRRSSPTGRRGRRPGPRSTSGSGCSSRGPSS